jgi:biopolymer transport protein TolR
MRRRRLDNNIKKDINVTPFVDVMLVLLIVFMVSAPMMVGGVEVDLPKLEGKELAGNDEPIIISVKKNGSIFLQEMPVSKDELYSKLRIISKRNKDTRIFIRGDKDVNYGTVLSLFSTMKEANLNNVALVTETE